MDVDTSYLLFSNISPHQPNSTNDRQYSIGTNLWLAYWSTQQTADEQAGRGNRIGFFLGIYVGLSMADLFVLGVNSILAAYAGVQGARVIFIRFVWLDEMTSKLCECIEVGWLLVAGC